MASSISNEILVTAPESIRTNELFSESISNSPFRNLNDHMPQSNLEDEKLEEADEMSFQETGGTEPTTPNLIGNSLSSLLTSSTWSTNTATIDNTEHPKSIERSDSCTTSISRKSNQRYSYNAILRKHETERVIDWTDVWKKFESSLSIQKDEEQIEPEYEVVSNPQSNMFTLENVQNMVELTCQLAVEKGLDQQGFLCDECAHPIGIDFSEAKYVLIWHLLQIYIIFLSLFLRKCAFSGKYVCLSCMSLDLILIPAKVIYNWDFKKYNVSRKYQNFLLNYSLQPFINIKVNNINL